MEIDKRSFQTTYEELKPISLCDISGLSNCFQTTYEELKLRMRNIGTALLNRFQTTYEELKLQFPKRLALDIYVFRLPMRN